MTIILNGTSGITFPDGTTQADGLATPVPVVDGGTGLSSPGTSGNVLTSNGTAWVSSTPAGGPSGVSGQAFTSNGTFTIPAGVTALKITVVGGGGAGGGCVNSDSVSAGGGGGGGAAISYLTSLTPGNTLAVTIGAGGTGTTGTGNTGGSSSVASGTQSISTITATGGIGGQRQVYNQENQTVGLGGAGGTASGGVLNLTGGNGFATVGVSAGGSSLMGSSRMTFTKAAAGVAAGNIYGGGGTGVLGPATVNANGGAGASGIVVFEW